MNLIREIFFSPMVVDAAGIILIVAASTHWKCLSSMSKRCHGRVTAKVVQ